MGGRKKNSRAVGEDTVRRLVTVSVGDIGGVCVPAAITSVAPTIVSAGILGDVTGDAIGLSEILVEIMTDGDDGGVCDLGLATPLAAVLVARVPFGVVPRGVPFLRASPKILDRVKDSNKGWCR